MDQRCWPCTQLQSFWQIGNDNGSKDMGGSVYRTEKNPGWRPSRQQSWGSPRRLSSAGRQTGSLAWPALRILPVYACYQTDAHYAWRLSDLVLTGQEICSGTVNPDPSFSTQKNLHILYQFTFLDSNTQWLFPSSSIWFHQRRPTISLPVTFWERQYEHTF